MFTWLKTRENERRLLLRTSEKDVDLLAWFKERASGQLPQTTEPLTVSEIVVANYGHVSRISPEPVLDSLQVDGKLVRTNKLVRSYGCHQFDFPMTVPHRRLLVANEQEQSVREWCAMHGFEDIVADRTEILDVNLPLVEVDQGSSQHSLFVYSCFGARIGPSTAKAYVGNGDNDPLPVRRFSLRDRPGVVLINGGPEFDGIAGVRYPQDPEGQREFSKLLEIAACWLAEWQATYGGAQDSDWPGWSDDEARAYAVALFQNVQKILHVAGPVPHQPPATATV